jgi:hypothetical protein
MTIDHKILNISLVTLGKAGFINQHDFNQYQ